MTIKSQFTKRDVQPVFTGNADFVQLPFPYLRLNWNNGNPQADKAGGAKHFGGWQTGLEYATEDCNLLGLSYLPYGFTDAVVWINDKGKEYQAYSARTILAAPILAKDDWWEEWDNKRGKSAKRHRLDFLVFLATLDENRKIQPYAPAVLSATGFAASAIGRAFRDWVKNNAEPLNAFAPDVPTQFFYVNVGTFGDKRVTEPAGDSVYVLCQCSRKEITEAVLNELYVGEMVAAQIVSLQAQAQDWLKDTHANRNKNFTEKSESGSSNQNASSDQSAFVQNPFGDEPPF